VMGAPLITNLLLLFILVVLIAALLRGRRL
jgi:hypothetical protein